MAAHVASATIRHHQQETKSHKAQNKHTPQNDQRVSENNVTCDNGALYASTPIANTDLGAISEIPGTEEVAFEICLSDENRRFQPASSSTPLKDKLDLASNPCHEVRSYTQSSSTCSTDTESTSSPIGDIPSSTASSIGLSSDVQQFIAPILGYEILEQRARFTVFKIHVQRLETQESWFVFRRFTDFARLNRKLRGLFPTLRFPLPPKRWFKNNFDPTFLNDRVQGLQAFVNDLLSRREICQCHHVRDFFCFDEPPGPDDCLEESRLRCDTLEDMVALLRLELTGKQAEIDAIRAELALTKAQRETLLKSLRMEHTGANGQRSAKHNKVDAVLPANQILARKFQSGRDASLNGVQMDSCEDSYNTANQGSDEDGGSRSSRETLIEKSGESASGQSPELSEQTKDIVASSTSSDSVDLGDSNQRESIRLRKYSYPNGRPEDTLAATDDNGNQTFSKPVGSRVHNTSR